MSSAMMVFPGKFPHEPAWPGRGRKLLIVMAAACVLWPVSAAHAKTVRISIPGVCSTSSELPYAHIDPPRKATATITIRTGKKGIRSIKVDFPRTSFGQFEDVNFWWEHPYTYNGIDGYIDIQPIDAKLVNEASMTFFFQGPKAGTALYFSKKTRFRSGTVKTFFTDLDATDYYEIERDSIPLTESYSNVHRQRFRKKFTLSRRLRPMLHFQLRLPQPHSMTDGRLFNLEDLEITFHIEAISLQTHQKVGYWDYTTVEAFQGHGRLPRNLDLDVRRR